jgi:tetratricopeptide (TPR) repeat protein
VEGTEADDKAKSLIAIAICYSKLGDKEQALSLLENAARTADGISKPYGKSQVLTYIADTYATLGETMRGSALPKKMVEIAERIGDEYERAKVLAKIAESDARLGETTKDRAFLKEAMSTTDLIKRDYDKAKVLMNVAASYAKLGETTLDSALLEEAITIAERGNYGFGGGSGGASYVDSSIRTMGSLSVYTDGRNTLIEIPRSYVKIAESSNDPTLYERIFKGRLPDFCKNQALDAILTSKSARVALNQLGSMTSNYRSEEGRAEALSRILMAVSRPDLIGKEKNLADNQH